MASGNTLCVFGPQANNPPSANNTVFDTRNAHLVLNYPVSVSSLSVFGGVLPRNYAGGGITVRLTWITKTAASGAPWWAVSFERHQSATTNLTSDHFAAEQTANPTVPGTTGVVAYTDIAFTDGAQIASLAIGESFRIKVRRDGTNGSDTLSDTVQLLRVELRET